MTSEANEKKLRFDAKELGQILGIPVEGFDVYVPENKTVLGIAQLLQLAQKLSQQPGLKATQSIKKGDMSFVHQLLFWFIIKNVIPRGQGRNLSDPMDQCLLIYWTRENKLNLPAIMIRHIVRIANTPREHDMRYGFLLTSIFEHFGVTLQKRMGVQIVDEIGSSTLMGCGFKLVKEEQLFHNRGPEHLFPLFLVRPQVGLLLMCCYRIN